MRVSALYFAPLVSLAVLSSTGCTRKTAPADDASVTAAVQSRLAADGAIGSEPIQTSVQSGIATLAGTVSSDAARALAANDAAQVAGVRTVVNNLVVQPPSPPQAAFVPVPAPVAPTARPERPIRHRERSSRASLAGQPSESRAAPIHAATPPPPDLSAQNVTPPAPPPAPVRTAPTFRDVAVPAGSNLAVRITQTLDSASTQQGQTFSGVLANDLVVNGAVVLPQGSAISGRVDAVQEAAHFKGNSLLTISLTSISRHGESIPLATDPYTKQGNGRGKNTAEKVGGGAAVGAILGGIFGGGKGAGIGAAAGGGLGAGANGITRGQQVQIPSESVVRFRLTNAITVRVRENAVDDATPRHPLE